MASKIITIHSDSKGILRAQAEPVVKFGKDLEHIIDKMLNTCAQNRGRGLAAPQIGISKQIIVVSGRVFINPEVLQRGTDVPEVEEEEGCLSVPDVFVKIKRPASILLAFSNLARRRLIIPYSDLARPILHEMDHLRGQLITDYENL